MAEVTKSKWTKLGTIKASKKRDSAGKPTGSYIQLGLPKDKYNPVNVKLVVTDLKGTVLKEVTNPNIHVQDPRNRPGITDDQKKRIPEYLLRELSLAPDSN